MYTLQTFALENSSIYLIHIFMERIFKILKEAQHFPELEELDQNEIL